jgi:hypothetical protein
MEATVVDKEAVMVEWNDGRLDDLSKRVDKLSTNTNARFDRLEDKVDVGFAQVDFKFDALGNRIDAKFDALYQMLMKAAWGLAVGLLTMVGGLIALIATKF